MAEVEDQGRKGSRVGGHGLDKRLDCADTIYAFKKFFSICYQYMVIYYFF